MAVRCNKKQRTMDVFIPGDSDNGKLSAIPQDLWYGYLLLFLVEKDRRSLLCCSKNTLELVGSTVTWKYHKDFQFATMPILKTIKILNFKTLCLEQKESWKHIPTTASGIIAENLNSIPSNWWPKKNKITTLTLQGRGSDFSVSSLPPKLTSLTIVLPNIFVLPHEVLFIGLRELYLEYQTNIAVFNSHTFSSLRKLKIRVSDTKIVHLIFNYCPYLEYLDLDVDFDLSLKPGMLSKTLKHLKLQLSQWGDRHQTNLTLYPECFPDTLETLDVDFDGSLIMHAKSMNQGLKHLLFGHDATLIPSFLRLFPSGLTRLQLPYNYNQQLCLGHLTQLETLKLPPNFNREIKYSDLPPNLTDLDLNCDFNYNIREWLPKCKYLRRLHLSVFFKQTLYPGDIPNTVEDFYMGSAQNAVLLPGIIPNKCKIVNLSDTTDIKIIPGSFPSTGMLKTILFPHNFNQPLKRGMMPFGVVDIDMNHTFNTLDIEVGSFPSTVRHLSLGDSFNQPLKKGVLPSNLKSLVLGSNFKVKMPPGMLPPSLEKLTINNKD